MQKIDFKKELKHLYKPSPKKVVEVDVPKMNFLMINGKGDPNTAVEYKQAIESLFSVSYTVKFMIKNIEKTVDYSTMPLEGLWWTEDMTQFSVDRKSDWLWTAMIMQPECVSADAIVEASYQVKQKKDLPALSSVRFGAYHEGRSAQILHIGSYDAEGPTIAGIHKFIEDRGGKLRGKHHEIYLSDARRTAPEKLKTIIRQPFTVDE